MDSKGFDHLARGFGQARSRRQAVRSLAGAAAGTFALAKSGAVQAEDATPAASPAADSDAAASLGTEISWLPVWTIKPGGDLAAVRALLDEMMDSARNEPGTLGYALYISDDHQTVIFNERYADDAAALAHQATFGKRFAARATEAMTCTRITVLGSPGEAVRQSVQDCNPEFLTPFGGFTAR